MMFLGSIVLSLGQLWGMAFAPVHGKSSLILHLLVAVLISAMLFFALQALPKKARKQTIMLCTFLAGLFYLLEFALPGDKKSGDNMFSTWLPGVGDAAAVIGAFTWGLGLINLTRVHGKAVARRREGWYNSLAFFIGLFGIMIFGFWKDALGLSPKSTALPSAGFRILFEGFFQNLSASVFSLLAFYIVSAAYRAFRIRSREATVMMVAAFIVMLGQVPIGQYLTHGLHGPILSSLRFESISEWLLTGVNGAAQRGIAFGMAVGALAMSLRIWLSLERGSFFDSEV